MNKCKICGNEFEGLICPRCTHNISIDLENRTLLTELTDEEIDNYNHKIEAEKKYWEENKDYTFDNVMKKLNELEDKLKDLGFSVEEQ